MDISPVEWQGEAGTAEERSMRNSADRILTTHVGSLPRPTELIEAFVAEDRGVALDRDAYESDPQADAVDGVVARQVSLGIDVVDDGEFSKRGFAVYANERLDGLEVPPEGARDSRGAARARRSPFPSSTKGNRPHGSGSLAPAVETVCVGPVRYKGRAQLDRDLANLRAAVDAQGAEEAFVPAISPVDVAGNQTNEHYPSDDANSSTPIARRDERGIPRDRRRRVRPADRRPSPRHPLRQDAGPRNGRLPQSGWSPAIEAINYALKGVPEDRVRYHTCYGINMGPRVHEVELGWVLDLVLKVEAGAYSFEAANPRHEHEWRLWKDTRLPDGKLLIPGVITHSSVLVEHPELIAERILRFAGLVGRENVIAGGDCGFGTSASATPEVHPSIVWAKFEALAEGARIASRTLWG